MVAGCDGWTLPVRRPCLVSSDGRRLTIAKARGTGEGDVRTCRLGTALTVIRHRPDLLVRHAGAVGRSVRRDQRGGWSGREPCP